MAAPIQLQWGQRLIPLETVDVRDLRERFGAQLQWGQRLIPLETMKPASTSASGVRACFNGASG